MNENTQPHTEASLHDKPDADAALATTVPDPSSFHAGNPFSQPATQALSDSPTESLPLVTTNHQATGESGVRPLTTWMGSVLCFLLGWFAVAVFNWMPVRQEAELPPPSKQSVAVQKPQADEQHQAAALPPPPKALPSEPPALTTKKEQVTPTLIQTPPPRVTVPPAVPTTSAPTASAHVTKVEDEGTRLRRIFNKTVQAANELKQ
jgi:hypothetical protein